MPHQAPEIVKLAERVLVDIEIAVRGFPRYHKYASGAALRAQATRVAILAMVAILFAGEPDLLDAFIAWIYVK
jgi:hypothetical protein